MKDALLAAARALDGGHWEEARERLRSAPLVRCDRSQRLVAVALWQRILAHSQNGIPRQIATGRHSWRSRNSGLQRGMPLMCGGCIRRFRSSHRADWRGGCSRGHSHDGVGISSWRAGNRAFPARPGEILARRGHPGQFQAGCNGFVLPTYNPRWIERLMRPIRVACHASGKALPSAGRPPPPPRSLIDGPFETFRANFRVMGRAVLDLTWRSLLAALLGNGSFDEARFGGCLTYDLSRRKSLQANLGYPTEYATTTRGTAAAASTAARRLVFVH